mmetsp:Transcript_3997/g.9321  ORF Transcript_3997/g.9321 Transcript_3997/m.9321 type:complete len:90 (-) Transcript_3997:618-887(-)
MRLVAWPFPVFIAPSVGPSVFFEVPDQILKHVGDVGFPSLLHRPACCKPESKSLIIGCALLPFACVCPLQGIKSMSLAIDTIYDEVDQL